VSGRGVSRERAGPGEEAGRKSAAVLAVEGL